MPSLLATGAVHHHLMRNGTRMRVGIIVETGEAREVHHFCLLVGYGAGAVNPVPRLRDDRRTWCASGTFPGLSDAEVAKKKYVKAINKGLLKVMSKMGISTLQSYHGAQIFEAIGLSPDVIDRYFTGTASRISGIDLDVIAEECRRRHDKAYPTPDAGEGTARPRRPVPLPRAGRAAPLEPDHGRQAPARRAHRGRKELQRVLGAHQRRRRRASSRCAACGTSRRTAPPCRSTRSSRRRRSSSASPPAR